MPEQHKLRNIVRGQNIPTEKADFARQLRRDLTPPERMLWAKLRRNQLNGFHFRRQQVIDKYIADFYCHQAALVVELDGETHDLDYDAERDKVFAQLGIEVLRFTNSQVCRELETVVEQIYEVCVRRSGKPTP